jgi:serine protease Do
VWTFSTIGRADVDDLDLLEQRAFQAAVARVAPSVVRIETVGGGQPIGNLELGSAPTTGLIVGADGHIVSSALSFLDKPDSILVQLPGGARKAARIVATDYSRLMVLLKIEVEEPLPVPEFAVDEPIRVGQWAIAVGRTFEQDRPNSAVGIVSAVNRVWGKAIQTDAATSPNNYGGPLVDVQGRVLGLLVPLSPEAADQVAGLQWYDSGIGFAVGAGDLLKAVARLKEGKDLRPGVAGISFPNATLPTAEPTIAAVHPNSPAYDAGLEAEDRVVEVAGQEIVRAVQVKEQLSRRYAGETVHLIVVRGEKRIEVDLQLAAELEPYAHPFLGVLPVRSRVDSSEARPKGVAVRHVLSGSPAAASDIRAGDVLTKLDGMPIQDDASLRRQISRRKPSDQVELEVARGPDTLTLTVSLGTLPEEIPDGPLPKVDRDQQPGELAPSEEGQPGPGLVELKVPEFENRAFAYVPEGYRPQAPHALLLWFDEPGPFDGAAFLARWKALCDSAGLILVVAESARFDKWQPSELDLAAELLENVRRTYAVDPTRIVAGGQASGGTLAYHVAFGNRDLVRAVATVNAPVTARPPENDPIHRLAVYVARSEGSRITGPIEQGIARLRAMKYPVSVQVLGAERRLLNPDELAALVRWIDALDRI